MGIIRVLPEQVANQIAAGEVVERPASIVKELMENALDAGARRVSIAIEGGGADLIRVADDGAGMSGDDAVMALQRHATSKVRRADDLKAIHTFGFRGEALPSIASVSRFDLTTCLDGATEGTRIRVEGGATHSVEPASHPRGTTIAVESLFFNAPARRKFLRSKGTESAHVADVVARIAAAHPAIAFDLAFGSREQSVWPVAPSFRERIAQIVGAEVAEHLVAVDRSSGRARVQGLASRPSLHRSTSRDEILYVNSRPIRDRRLLHAVQLAYATLLPKGRFPSVYLFLELPPEDVDVNVHPAKSEVRFLHGSAMHDLVHRALLDALGLSRPFQGVSGGAFTASEPAPSLPGRAAAGDDADGHRPHPSPAGEGGIAPISPGRADETPPGDGSEAGSELPLDITGLRALAQFHDTYILTASPDGLIIVDQHAAHERVLYERLLGQAGAGAIAQQALLFPVTLEVSGAQSQSLHEFGDLLRGLGFSIEPFGPDAVRIDALPALPGNIAADRLLREILDEVLEWGRAESVDRLRSRLAATTACHAAVRANHPLVHRQMQQIVTDLMEAGSPMTCPHGRPTLLRFPLARLEREFRRR
jgi:DNA mismatch repair protein MutL